MSEDRVIDLERLCDMASRYEAWATNPEYHHFDSEREEYRFMADCFAALLTMLTPAYAITEAGIQALRESKGEG